MLKFSAVDLYNAVRVGIKNFGRGFYHPGFSGAGWAQKKHCANWPVGRIHPCQKNLVQAAHAAHGTLLTNDARPQAVFKILGARTLLIWVKKDGLVYMFFRVLHSFTF